MAAITAALVKELRDMTGAGMMDCKKALSATEGDIQKAVDYLRENGLAKAAKKSGRVAAEGLARVAINAEGTEAAVVEVNSETDFVAKNPDFIDFVEKVAEIALNDPEADCEKCILSCQYGDEGTVSEALTSRIATIGENMSIRRLTKLATPGVKYVGYTHGGGRICVIVGLKTDAELAEITECGKDVAMQIASMNPKFVDESAVDPEYLAHEKEILIAQAQKESPDKPQNIIEKMIQGRLKKSLKETCLTDQVFVKNSELSVKQYVDSVAKAIGKSIQVAEMVRYEVGEGLEKREENFAEEVAKQMKG
ncbi:MAG: elongation factor Ts [Firmicutes bacterium]|nr:elongation factor Ts [Bacillota bacterium]MBQ4371421.1 elongation factor Ts [Bacillota bacterium]